MQESSLLSHCDRETSCRSCSTRQFRGVASEQFGSRFSDDFSKILALENGLH